MFKVILGLAFVSHAGFPASFSLETATGNIEFLAVGRPSAIKIRGMAPQMGNGQNSVSGILRASGPNLAGKVKLKLSALDTGIELRNHHMKEKYLEVEKFPEAELTIPSIEIGKKDEVPWEGELSLHGKKKPVKGTATVDQKEKTLGLSVSFDLKVTDFDIPVPSYLGIKVTDNVKVSANVAGPILP